MKNLITILLLFFAVNIQAQSIKLIHINAKWNQDNNYPHLRGLKNVDIQMAFLEDQTADLRSKIKAVPVILLIDKNGKPIFREDGKVLKSDLYFKPNINKILDA